MTENEANQILNKIFPEWNGDSKWLSADNIQKIINSYTKVMNVIQKYEEPGKNEFLADMKSNHVGILSELKQYRNLGTIEFLTDMKSNYVEVLSDLRQYQKIGTIEECREARGKQRKKNYINLDLSGRTLPGCPMCKRRIGILQRCCEHCGQAIDWSDTD